MEQLQNLGLSNYLSGIGANEEEGSENILDYIQETEVKNLYLMPAGNIPPNPSELLISPQMVKLLDEVKEMCDIVILDGTPNELVTDSLILTRLVDSTIIVTASQETKKDNLQRVINSIQNVGGKIAGVVLNKIPVSAKKYEQSYYYGASPSGNKKSSVLKSRTQNSMKKEQPINRNIKPVEDDIIKESKVDSEEIPKGLKTDIETENKEDDNLQKGIKIDDVNEKDVERTNDILKQINEYLEKEKNNLN